MMPTRLITRRRAIMTGLAAAGGFVVTRDWTHLPPTYGSLLRMGDNLTYAALRALPRQSLVKEGQWQVVEILRALAPARIPGRWNTS